MYIVCKVNNLKIRITEIELKLCLFIIEGMIIKKNGVMNCIVCTKLYSRVKQYQQSYTIFFLHMYT